MDTRLHCVYLLVSLDPTCKDHCYIGYTTNPLRRLRQHNGEIANGAWRTSRRGRPWKLVAFVSGFPEDRMGLKFEWCWQHPSKALMIRESLASGPQDVQRALQKYLSSLGGGSINRAPYAIAMLHVLLRCEMFQSLCLRLNIVDDALWNVYTTPMYAKSTGTATLPAAKQTKTSTKKTMLSLSQQPPQLSQQPLIVAAAPSTTASGLALLSAFPPSHPLLHIIHVSTDDINELLPNTADSVLLSQMPLAAPSRSFLMTSYNDNASDDVGSHDNSMVRQDSATAAATAAPSFVRSLMASSEEGHVEHWASRQKVIGSSGNASHLADLTVSSIAGRATTAGNNTDLSAISGGNGIDWSTSYHQNSRITDASINGASHPPPPLICTFCALPLQGTTITPPPPVMLCQRPHSTNPTLLSSECTLASHVTCLALWFHINLPEDVVEPQEDDAGDPLHGSSPAPPATRRPPFMSQSSAAQGGGNSWRLIPRNSCLCPLCGYELHWSIGVQQVKQRINATKALQLAQRRDVLDAALEARLAAIGGGQQVKQRINATKALQLAQRRDVLDAALEARLAAIGGGPSVAPRGGRGRGRARGSGGDLAAGRGSGEQHRKRARSNTPDTNDNSSVNQQRGVAPEQQQPADESYQPDWWLDL
ncbi:Hypothetical protein, putative [Bodo saltans]|uniref:Structure-specific endonuclease subunit SLX1 homolog n=1 Tax=Bodo saltans TaxID=75058 RepID=A0A0S4J7X3_BODSA|nr:Hypothetical protein, putative [Bodo saltans]|eukprot:CUG87532.1 Hypothetical protein, putative [Bodo saltans]